MGKNQPLRKEHPKWKSDVPLTEGQLRSKRDEFWDTAPVFEGKCVCIKKKKTKKTLINSLASARIQGFLEKKHLNARGFAREFLRSGMLYRPGKSLKRRGKSSRLHSKKIFFAWEVRVFCE